MKACVSSNPSVRQADFFPYFWKGADESTLFNISDIVLVTDSRAAWDANPSERSDHLLTTFAPREPGSGGFDGLVSLATTTLDPEFDGEHDGSIADGV